MKIRGIRHITLAVRDLERACATFESLLDEEAAAAVAIPAFGARTHDLPLGDATLQLAASTDPEGALLRFVERRGEGVYNIALEVDDLDKAIAELASRGIRVSAPVEATPGLRSAFITMSATHGMSIQLVEDLTTTAQPSPEPRPAGHPTAPQPIADRAPIPEPATPQPAAIPDIETESQQPSDPSAEDASGQPSAKQPLDLRPDEWEIGEWSDLD